MTEANNNFRFSFKLVAGQNICPAGERLFSTEEARESAVYKAIRCLSKLAKQGAHKELAISPTDLTGVYVGQTLVTVEEMRNYIAQHCTKGHIDLGALGIVKNVSYAGKGQTDELASFALTFPQLFPDEQVREQALFVPTHDCAVS
ncbi:MAG: hypothetical protein L6Q57_02615 [Alphaproteobacteria bacterium]|nr:hypothetical protein [Alphaproteobacteria bacterium]